MVSGCLGLTPKEIEAALAGAHAAYMDSLYAHWLAADHPDIRPNGRPCSRKLTAHQRITLMRERVGKVADLVKPTAWHDDCYSPRSSQALFVELMGVLLETNLIGLLLPSGATAGCGVSFEQKIRGRTNFDAILRYSDSRVYEGRTKSETPKRRLKTVTP